MATYQRHTAFELERAARATRYGLRMLHAVTPLMQPGHFADDVLGQNLVTEGVHADARGADQSGNAALDDAISASSRGCSRTSPVTGPGAIGTWIRVAA